MDNTKMQMNNLDTLTVEQILMKAHEDANIFCTGAKISELIEVKNYPCNVAYINYNIDIDYIEFNIHNNPIGIFPPEVNDKDKIKGTNYSFPITCVSNNVIIYFDEYVNYINKNFDFTTIKGKTEYKDTKLKKTGIYKNIRKFFNMPEETKTKDPTMLGHLKIEPKWLDKQAACYNLMIRQYDSTLIDNINNINNLSNYLSNRSSFKVYVKPTKIGTCYKYYGEEYRITWQLFAAKELGVKSTKHQSLRNLLMNEINEPDQDINEEELIDDDM
jgi:hypothetical protein